jgi:hypothetical protein
VPIPEGQRTNSRMWRDLAEEEIAQRGHDVPVHPRFVVSDG